MEAASVIEEVTAAKKMVADTKQKIETEIKLHTERLGSLNGALMELTGVTSIKKRGRPKSNGNGYVKIEAADKPTTYAQRKLLTLPSEFTKDEARKAFRTRIGTCLAQLTRGGRITKTKDGYKKI